MQAIGTIAVVVSVLVLAYHAREVARQSRIANRVAALQADSAITQLSTRISDVFIQYPELRSRFFDELPNPSSATEARLMTVADQYADVLQVALDTTARLGPYGWETEDIRAWAASMVESSTHLRSIIRDNPGLWPPLEPFVANHDASHGIG
jgi:hypothetical protein